MARRSLKPQLNQIRTWVRQGRTDAWIAHQLQVAVREIDAFKREHGLAPDGEEDPGFVEDLDLRAEDDALVAAELDAEPEQDEDDDADEGDRDRGGDDGDGREGGHGGDQGERRRRRGRRGGRGRKRRKPLEGTFDHGEDGYGLWLDPSVQKDSVYAEHWAGHRPVTVSIEPDRIVIRRAGEDAAGEGEAGSGSAPDPDEFAA